MTQVIDVKKYPAPEPCPWCGRQRSTMAEEFCPYCDCRYERSADGGLIFRKAGKHVPRSSRGTTGRSGYRVPFIWYVMAPLIFFFGLYRAREWMSVSPHYSAGRVFFELAGIIAFCIFLFVALAILLALPTVLPAIARGTWAQTWWGATMQGVWQSRSKQEELRRGRIEVLQQEIATLDRQLEELIPERSASFRYVWGDDSRATLASQQDDLREGSSRTAFRSETISDPDRADERLKCR